MNYYSQYSPHHETEKEQYISNDVNRKQHQTSNTIDRMIQSLQPPTTLPHHHQHYYEYTPSLNAHGQDLPNNYSLTHNAFPPPLQHFSPTSLTTHHIPSPPPPPQNTTSDYSSPFFSPPNLYQPHINSELSLWGKHTFAGTSWLSLIAKSLYDPRLKDKIVENKGGISIEKNPSIDFGYIDFSLHEKGDVISLQNIPVIRGPEAKEILQISNHHPSSPVFLTSIICVSSGETYFNMSKERESINFGIGASSSIEPMCLSVNETLELEIGIAMHYGLGIYQQWFLFVFEVPTSDSFYSFQSNVFIIARKFSYRAVVAEDVEALNVNAKPFVPNVYLQVFYSPPEATINVNVSNIPFASEYKRIDAILPHYDPSKTIQDILKAQTSDDSSDVYLLSVENKIDEHKLLSKLQTPLDIKNYQQRFLSLLNIEELQMKSDVAKYDIYNTKVKLLKKKNSISMYDTSQSIQLKVLGVNENRPALLNGDFVYFRPVNFEYHNIEIRGIVVEIRETIVTFVVPNLSTYETWCFGYDCILQSHQKVKRNCPIGTSSQYRLQPCGHIGLCQACWDELEKYKQMKSLKIQCSICGSMGSGVMKKTINDNILSLYSSHRFHVRFSYQRLGLRLIYHTLRYMPSHIQQFIFPTQSEEEIQPSFIKSEDIKLFNPVINTYQLQAIVNILNKSSKGAPYLIFGPAGTGKTMTLIETILQITKYSPNAKILVTAPSDTAADILALRLRQYFSNTQMVRLNWYYRKIASVPGALLSYCLMETNHDIFRIPNTNELETFSIVICSCVYAGLLNLKAETCGYFTHIIFDEMSQAMEPQTLVPLSLSNASTQIVLAGDPKQLGAILRSPIARKYGLDMSYQERLMEMDLYRTGDCRYITKLLYNYRSHNVILKLPSKLFYNNELKACADPRLVDSLCSWEQLSTTQQFPLLFYGIIGKDYHEVDSPSYFNPLEASQVTEIIISLLNSKQVNVKTEDIGVITPFRQQVLKLRRLLRSRNLGNINVGSVDDYQGQEAKVIIISTVLSHMLLDDENNDKDSLAMLGDPKRFNVAITRAKALVIVVGHPIILSEDKYWRQVIDYCIQNDSYRGCDCPLLLNSKAQQSEKTLIERIAEMPLLGAGDQERMYPQNIETYYRDDPEWKVIM